MNTLMLILSVFSLSQIQDSPSASPWPYQHVNKNAGLSNSAITSVYMDRAGFIWMGSWDGINRYDGSIITTYKPNPFQEGAIGNNIIRNFLEDQAGDLWIVTHKGISRYESDTDTFNNYLEEQHALPYKEYNLKACLGPNGTIWASIFGKGITYYDAKTDSFEPAAFKEHQEWLKTVVDIAYHEQTLYLLGNDGKLAAVKDDTFVYKSAALQNTSLKYHQFLVLENQFYLALSTGNGQINFYSPQNPEANPQTTQMGLFPITSISESLNKNAAWVGNENGNIYKIKLIKGRLSVELMDAYMPQFSKQRVKILSITEGRQNLLWIGTDGDGAYKFLTRKKPFYALEAGDGSTQLSHNIIRSVYESPSGDLYVGTRGGGLNVVDHAGLQATQVLNTANGLSHNAILAVNQDHHGNTWVGTDGPGLDMIETETGKIYHFPDDFEDAPQLHFSSVYTICVDAFNKLWLGTSGHGVIYLDIAKTAKGQYRVKDHYQVSYDNGQDMESIKSNVVYAIVEEQPNILWFGTRGAGLYRFNALNRQVEAHIHTSNPVHNNRLINDDVLSLLIDSHDELWIGTSGGLSHMTLGIKPFKTNHYGYNNDLYNNTIHGILEDETQNIWISTNNGLSMLDRDRNDFKNFDTKDGLRNNEFTDGAAFRSAQTNTLYFGGIHGLDIVYPSLLDTGNYFPPITITQFQVRNVLITPGDDSNILSQHINKTDKIKLAYDQNFISFNFTTLNHWNKQKSDFAYFLENFDQDWNVIGQQATANLTNIPPGDYRLHINYTNDNGIWNPNPRIIDITVTPPFWKSPWAYVLYVLLILMIQVGIVLYIRWRTKIKKELIIDKFKIQKLKELNDYKLKFFTNLAHEFRTPLTLILGPVAALMHKNKAVEDNQQLRSIFNNAVRMQKLIQELIQFRKIESNKEKLDISHTDLVKLSRELLQAFEQFAFEREIRLELVAKQSITGWTDVKKLEKILINLISNAIKYNHPGGQVQVILSLEGEDLRIDITDTGEGIASDIKDEIFKSFYHNPHQTQDKYSFSKSAGLGLSLTKSLVTLLNGNISVESKQGAGSTFTVILPVTENAYAETKQDIVFDNSLNIDNKVALEFETSLGIQTPTSIEHNKDARAATLLLVDDNQEILKLLAELLSEKYNYYTASNGAAALQLLEQRHIDLVISDIMMPDTDGLALCESIKDNILTSHIPVILLTAKAEIEHRIEGLQVGADSYIPKPFHPEHLLVRIEKLIESRELIKKRLANLVHVELDQIATGIGEKDDAFFSKITACIQTELSNMDLNAEFIAHEVGMSKASLYKKVKAVTGITPHALIRQYRLNKAAELLKNTEMSVSSVIFETGFNSRSHFYKSFNETFGCHPKDFKQQVP